MKDWRELYQDNLKNMEQLRLLFKDSPEHLNALPDNFNEIRYPLFIPKSFAKTILDFPVGSALWKQFIPNSDELIHKQGMIDPIGDQVHQKTKQLIHRYKNRALFIPTTVCPVHCRYCFRKNELHDDSVFSQELDRTLNYIQQHTEIEEIIFTGGDPFILSDKKIQKYLELFSSIEHIKFIRFHTRTPVLIPERLNPDLLETLKSFKSRFRIFISLHINHPDELSNGLINAINLYEAHFTMIAQTVLLKDINDESGVLIKLFKQLSQIGVLPYYLHHPDLTLGTEHFQLSLEHGREIYAQLRNELSGWMLPEYVIDIPGGHGKTTAYNSESYTFSGLLIDRKGEVQNISQPGAKCTTL